MPQTTLVSVPFRPSSPLTGSANEMAIYRGANVLLRGRLGAQFYAAYSGSLDLDEPIPAVPLSGSIIFDTISTTVTGSGTSFLDELHIGQMVTASNGEPLVVSRIVSQTEFICARVPQSSGSLSATISPRLIELNQKRCAGEWISAIHTDRGNILGVGRGTMYINGAVLPGTSFVAKRKAQIAIYDSSTGQYTVRDIGFTDTPVTDNTDVTVVASGGTKNTSAGYYSFKVGYYSDVTNGYGNPGPTLLESGTAGYHVTVANSTFNFDFSSDVSNRPANATGYIIYASPFTNSSDQSAVNAIQGGWFEVLRVPFTSLSGGDAIAFDYTDADLGSLVSFDNDPPPDAEFIASLAGFVNLISTEGQGVDSTGRETTTSPGPFVSPMKATNLDGYPGSFETPTEKGETIIGCVSAAGRLFVLTPNTLQAVTPTGLDAAPITVRPFWKMGFANPYNLIFVGDTLYGFTSKGMFRSIATGDSADAQNDFASSVNAQMASWEGGYVYLAYDPKNRCVCIFHTASGKNLQGYWETTVYLYNLDIYDWIPAVILSSPTRDMIVTGVATVQNSLEFIAGGRRSGTTDQFDTFVFDGGGGESVDWHLAWNFQDSGVEFISKCIRKLRPRGQFTDTSIQVYAATPDTDIDVTDLDTGANPAFEYSLADSTTVKTYDVQKARVRNALLWTVRIGGTSVSDGTLESLDQFHEMSVELDSFGQMR